MGRGNKGKEGKEPAASGVSDELPLSSEEPIEEEYSVEKVVDTRHVLSILV